MPCDYSKYPPDWKQRRERILKRAGNRCEFCNVPNHEWICRVQPKVIPGHRKPKPDDYYICTYYGDDAEARAKWSAANTPGFFGAVYIILTIAHLDHDPENWDVSDDRLAALCQRCHLDYDRESRREKTQKELIF